MANEQHPTKRYYVFSRGEAWEVVADCRYLARFATRGAAIQQAINWAHTDGKSGYPTQVLVEVRPDDFKVAWIYGDAPD